MADRNESIGISLALKITDFIKGLGDARSATETAAKGMGTAFETETTSRLDKLKARLSELKDSKATVSVSATSVDVVTTRISELKARLAQLSEQKVSLGDMASINASESAIRGAESELRQLGTTLSGLGPEGQKAFEKLKLGAKETEGPLSNLKSVALGMFAAGGMIGAAREFGETLKSVFEAGKGALQDEEKLTLAFKGNAKEAKEASENADRLAMTYNIMPGALKEISANAALMGGFTGEANKNITELAAGMEGLKVPGINATAVVRAFTMGAGDPEGQAGLGRLNRAFPLLASGLAGITDPAEKAKKALEIMGPQFQMLQAQAGDSANASERMGVAMKVFEESVGKVLYGALATYVIPILAQFVQGLTWLSQGFDHLGPVVKTFLGILGALTTAIIVATAVEKAHIVEKVKSFAASAVKITQDVYHTIVKWAGVAADIAATIATTALAAATWLLTTPVGILVLAVAGLGIAVYEAYQHFEPFRNVVDAVGEAIKKAAEFVWKFKEYFIMLLGPVGMAVGALMLLYEKVEFVHKAFDAIGGFFTKLFGGGPKEGAEAVAAVKETFDKTFAARQEADAKALAQQRATLTTKLTDIKANEEAGLVTKQQADEQKAAAQKKYDDFAKKQNDDFNAFQKSKLVEQTKAIQDEYDKQKKALVDSYKAGKTSAEDFNAEMGKLDAILKSQKESIEKTGDAWAVAKAKYDKYAADIAGKQEANTKDIKQEVDNSIAMINDALKSLGMTSEKEYLAAQKRGFPGLNKDAVKEAVDNINYAHEQLKKLHEDEARADAAGRLGGTIADDPNAKKEKKEKDAFAQRIANTIAFEKEQFDIGKQSRETTLANIRALTDVVETASIKLTTSDLEALQKRYQQDKDFGLTSLSWAEYQAQEKERIRTKAAQDVHKAIEEQVKGREEAQKAADQKEVSELDKKHADIQKKLADNLKAIDTLRKQSGGDLGDEAANAKASEQVVAATKKAHDEELAADADYFAKKRKAAEDARKQILDDEKKSAEDKASLAENTEKSKSGGGDPLKLIELGVAKKLALLNIEIQQERNAAIAKFQIWQDAEQKKVDLMADGPEKIAAQHALDLAEEKKYADIDVKLGREREDKKTDIELQAANDRRKAILDHLQKENVLYAAAMEGLHSLWADLTKAMTSALNQFFGFEKSGMAAMTANDIALAKSDKDKKIAALSEEVQKNKISYQDYVLQKTKLEEDYNKKMKGNSQSLTDMLAKAEQTVVDSVIGAIAKKAEAWIADQVTRLALSLVYKATDTTASIAQAAATAAAWAPAAAAASVASFGAADIAGMAGLTAAYTASATEAAVAHDQGGVYDPRLHGGKPQYSVMGETGKKEFASPETTAREYFVQDLGPQIMKLMEPKAQQVYRSLQMNNGIVPPISPLLSSSVASGGVISSEHVAKLTKTLDKLHAVASDLQKNGIDATIGERHFQDKLRSNGKAIEGSLRGRSHEVLRRSGTSGGGIR